MAEHRQEFERELEAIEARIIELFATYTKSGVILRLTFNVKGNIVGIRISPDK